MADQSLEALRARATRPAAHRGCSTSTSGCRAMRRKTKLENSEVDEPVEIPTPRRRQRPKQHGTFYLTNKHYQIAFLVTRARVARVSGATDRLGRSVGFAFIAGARQKPAPMRMPCHFVSPTVDHHLDGPKRLICVSAHRAGRADETLRRSGERYPPSQRRSGLSTPTKWRGTEEEAPARCGARRATSIGTGDRRLGEQVAQSLHIDPAWLAECDVLLDRGQIVLHGPPGTGKTMSRGSCPCRSAFTRAVPQRTVRGFIEG